MTLGRAHPIFPVWYRMLKWVSSFLCDICLSPDVQFWFHTHHPNFIILASRVLCLVIRGSDVNAVSFATTSCLLSMCVLFIYSLMFESFFVSILIDLVAWLIYQLYVDIYSTFFKCPMSLLYFLLFPILYVIFVIIVINLLASHCWF